MDVCANHTIMAFASSRAGFRTAFLESGFKRERAHVRSIARAIAYASERRIVHLTYVLATGPTR